MEDTQNAPPKEFSYLIFIAACLAMPSLMLLVAFRRNAEVPFDAGNFAFKLALFFSFCSLAWMVGRKYDLHYILRCVVGGIAFTLPVIIARFGNTPAPEALILASITMICGALIFGGILLAISYPFQILFFKLRSNGKPDLHLK